MIRRLERYGNLFAAAPAGSSTGIDNQAASFSVNESIGGPLRFVCAPSGFMERRVNKAHANYAYEHRYDRGDPHRARPSRRDQLGLKIILLALSVSGFVLFSVNAFVAFRVFASGLAVCFGVLASLMLVESL
jgi:hypothetical protein